MTITHIQPRAVAIDAVQWDASEGRAEELWEWTAQAGAIGNAWPTRFMPLGSDDSYTVFGDLNDTLEIVGTTVKDLLAQGYTAAVYDPREGQWLNVRTGDWILHHPDGRWTVVTPEILSDNYQPATVARSS